MLESRQSDAVVGAVDDGPSVCRGRPIRQPALGAIALGALMVLLCPPVLALDPSLDVSQYGHTAWRVRDGFTTGSIICIAQTPDGYLWVGTEFGLFRFDGVRAIPWQHPQGQLPGNHIETLLAAHDGALWIGTHEGLASWKNGKLTTYAERSGQDVLGLVEDRDGTVWAGGVSFPPPGKLCAIRPGGVRCCGEDGSFGIGVIGLYQDRRGNLWVGIENGMWRWTTGHPEFFSLAGEASGIAAFAAVLQEILAKLMAMAREEQEAALAELTAFSGILKLDDLLNQKLKEFPMLTVDLKENAVVRPLIEEGRKEGRQALFLDLLAEKFGALPPWAYERVQKASAEELDRWARRVLRSSTLEDTLGC